MHVHRSAAGPGGAAGNRHCEDRRGRGPPAAGARHSFLHQPGRSQSLQTVMVHNTINPDTGDIYMHHGGMRGIPAGWRTLDTP
eukprot:scaffold110609_cov42-Tisochrysis_lutea.AAC.1